MSDPSDNWVPEIMYEESSDGISSSLPFIMVPKDLSMPKLLYVFESRATGELEPGSNGEDVPVVQWDLHQYADMGILKERLSMIEYDNVRFVLELEPLSLAVNTGRDVTNKIRENLKNKE
jgi:hypothetical protein